MATIKSINVLLTGNMQDLQGTYDRSVEATTEYAAATTKSLGEIRREQAVANREMAAFIREGAKLTGQLKTPIEEFESRMAHLSLLLEAGTITTETYSRAWGQATLKMNAAILATEETEESLAGQTVAAERATAAEAAMAEEIEYTTAVVKQSIAASEEMAAIQESAYAESSEAATGFAASSTEAAEATSAASVAAEGLESAATSLAPVLFAAFAAQRIVDSIRDRARDIDALTRSAEGLHIPFENLQEIQNVVFVKANISAEDFNTVLARMTKNLGQAIVNGGETAKTLEKVGISLDQLRGLNPDQQFRVLIDDLSKISDGNERAAAAGLIFGRSYAQLNPIIEGGAAAMNAQIAKAHELGEIIGNKDAQAFRDDAEAMRQFAEQTTGLEASFVRLLRLNQVVGSISEAMADLHKAITPSSASGVDQRQGLFEQREAIASIISATQTLLAIDEKDGTSVEEKAKQENDLIAALNQQIAIENQLLSMAEARLKTDKPGSQAYKTDASIVAQYDQTIAHLQFELDSAQKSAGVFNEKIKDEKKALEESKKAAEEAAESEKQFNDEIQRLVSHAETPAEKSAHDISILTEALAEGKISWEQYGEAMAKALADGSAAASKAEADRIKKQNEENEKQVDKLAEKYKRDQAEGQRIHEEDETPQEKAAEHQKELNRLLREGVITEQDFNREQNKIQDALNPKDQRAKGDWRQFDFSTPTEKGAHADPSRETNRHLQETNQHLGKMQGSVESLARAMSEVYRFQKDQHENSDQAASL